MQTYDLFCMSTVVSLSILLVLVLWAGEQNCERTGSEWEWKEAASDPWAMISAALFVINSLWLIQHLTKDVNELFIGLHLITYVIY